MNSGPLFVEFAGLPGAGKTTIVRTITKRLRKENYGVYTREMLDRYRAQQGAAHRGFSLLLYLVRNVSFVLKSIAYGALFKPINLKSIKFSYNAVRTAFKSGQAIANADLDGCRMVVFDQGLLQDLWSVGVTGEPEKSEAMRSKLLELLKPAYRTIKPLIVSIEVDPKRATERIQLRDPSPYRFDKMDIRDVSKTLAAKKPYLEMLVETVSSLNSVEVLKIQNNDDIPDSELKRLIELISGKIEKEHSAR